MPEACFNLAVLFKKGDKNVLPDAVEFQKYKEMSQDYMKAVKTARAGMSKQP